MDGARILSAFLLVLCSENSWGLELQAMDLSSALSPGLESFSLGYSLLASPPLDQLELDERCRQLLQDFADSGMAFTGCILRHARPVRLCQACFSSFLTLSDKYKNITKDVEKTSGNISCAESLLQFDRVQVLVLFYDFMENMWGNSKCDKCFSKNQVSNTTLYFMDLYNDTLTCFGENLKGLADVSEHQGNHSDLCNKCKESYRKLNDMYSKMKMNDTLCIDVEDAMNMTRRLWSKTFKCSVPCSDTVPVIAVAGFLLFLPVIFYLSSFLHSEQKKRKLILAKRLKSNNSLMNIQEKCS
ncbi:osteopetrosis-associated transmembrane protein 1 [Latimeria chalumnae]|uniref:osteopetrosis-associated transmembrane protein 1 n=1 Tax=Latimeria chalumnae TaxID=7897 RepID=UPI0006D8E862|nr:PREDICTED: osteopetrosis-associated transmembrane protein 1 [Latimeria chalumnae]|eukprot:XP_014341867.1 PREDICTED: osteopetrosis-associated transmembrane protein 1 [Latimeria chalumnae]